MGRFFSLVSFLIMKLVILLIIAFLQHAVSSMEDLLETFSEFFKKTQNKGLTEPCRAALGNVSSWTLLKIFDASSKVPSGVLNLNMFDLGNFDECYQLFEEIDDGTITYGKYCLSTINIGTSIPLRQDGNKDTKMLGTRHVGLHLAYCLLSPCTSEDFANIFKWATFDDQYCYSQDTDPELDASDCTAIVIFSILALLVILSTSYDLFLYYTEKEAPHVIFLAFSLRSNGRKILKTTSSGGQLSCINGFKALSMMWVIYGHENSLLMTGGTMNYKDVSSFAMDKKNMYVLAAQVSVDTFFAIAGLLTVYSVLKSKVKGTNFVHNLPKFYVHRYLRLTPAFAFIILFNSTLLRFMGSGPFWGNVQEEVNKCRSGWWGSLLYIQNYIDPLSSCAPQSWYLYVDTQLFAVSSLVIIPLLLWPTIGLSFLGLLILAGIIVPFCITYGLDLSAGLITGENYLKYYYTQPYSRCGPYFIGMLFGWLIYKLKTDEIVVSKRTCHQMAVVLWPVAVAGTAACLYGGADLVIGENTSILASSFYNGFNRNCWALSCCIIITLCSIGHGGPINAFLSLPLFQILAKLSYSMYLVHYTIVITVRLMSIRAPIYFSFWSVVHSFLGDFMLTLIGAFFLSSILESPVMIIEKFIFSNDNHSKTQNKSPVKNNV